VSAKSKLNNHAKLIFNIKRTDHYTFIPSQNTIMEEVCLQVSMAVRSMKKARPLAGQVNFGP
jgi:hypothetical protein